MINITKLLTILVIMYNSFFTYYAYSKPRLVEYAYNKYSQFGEDGVIEKIFEIIGTKSKMCVEFGAWDGFYLSNTANLWSKDSEWKGILIEMDYAKFAQLKTNVKDYNCFPIKAKIGVEPTNLLENILLYNKIGLDVDLLSIDIDSNDYYVFETLNNLQPRLVVVEYNPSIPVQMDLYAAYGDDNYFGCSVGALVRIGAQKGYRLVALTQCNAFFVHENDFNKFAEFETSLPLLDVNNNYFYLVTSYDGRFAVVKNFNHSFYGLTKEKWQGKLLGNFSSFSVN